MSVFMSTSKSTINPAQIQELYKFLPIERFDCQEYINSKNFLNVKKCEEHKSVNCDHFCIDCRTSICIQCYNHTHKQHRSLFKPHFLKNPHLEIFGNIDKSMSEYFKCANPQVIKEELINEVNIFHQQLLLIVEEFKRNKIEEIENIYEKITNVSKDFDSRYQQAKLTLGGYMKQFENYYPNNYSDIMFLQNFDIVNSASKLKKESEEYLKNLININHSYSVETKNEYSQVNEKIESLINELNQKEGVNTNITAITERFTKFERLVSENTKFNKAYIKQLENIGSNISNKIDNFTSGNNQYSYLNIGSQNTSFYNSKNKLTTANPTVTNSMHNSPLQSNRAMNDFKNPFSSENTNKSSKSNTVKFKVEKTPDNNNNNNNINFIDSSIDNNYEKNLTTSRKHVNKSIDFSTTHKNLDSNNELTSPIKLKKGVKFDIRLFNLSFIHFINTLDLKWDDFLSFSNNPNEQLHQNKTFIKEMQLRNLVTPQFLKMIESHYYKTTTERSCNNGKLVSNKTHSQFTTIDDDYQEIQIKPIEGTDFIQITDNRKVVRIQVDMEKLIKEFNDRVAANHQTINLNSSYNIKENTNINSSSNNIKTICLNNDEKINTINKINNSTITGNDFISIQQNNDNNSTVNNNSNKYSNKASKTNTSHFLVNNSKTINNSNTMSNFNSKYTYELPTSTTPPYSEFPFGIKTIILGNDAYLIGGKSIMREYPTIACFNLKTYEFNFIANMIKPRSYTALYSENNKIYIVGGENNKTCEEFDLISLKSSSLPNLTQNRANSILYIYKKTFLYCFCGYNKSINNTDPLNSLESVERIILNKDYMSKLGLHNYNWDKVPITNLTGIDIKLECYGLTSITDNYIMLYGGYSARKNKRVMIVFDVVKHEINTLSGDMIRKIKKLLLESADMNKLLEEYTEEKILK